MTSIEDFLQASSIKRAEALADPSNDGILEAYFGHAALAEYKVLAAKTLASTRDKHLEGKDPRPNLIFVPGVMGSVLKSDGLGGIWWIDVRTRKHINDLRLSADGAGDVDPAYGVAACGVDPSYEAFLLAVIRSADLSHTCFPYDWRRLTTQSAAAFRDTVLKTYESNGKRRVHIVAHSMGGMIVRVALMRHPELWDVIGRIVFLATPHYGAPAIAGYLKGHLWGRELMALLGFYLDRVTFRSLRGVLSLLPAPAGIYPGTRPTDKAPWSDPAAKTADYRHPCASFDLYDEADWGLTLEPSERLQESLTEISKLYSDLHSTHQALSQEYRDRMAVIAGVGYRTLFRLSGGRRLGFLWKTTIKETEAQPGDPHREGDGRVPVASANLEFVGATRYVKGEHGSIPSLPEVYEDVFRWLRGRPEEMRLSKSVEDALSTHLGSTPTVNPTPHLDGSDRVRPLERDPGYLDFEELTASRQAEMEKDLDEGRLPDFIRTRLL